MMQSADDKWVTVSPYESSHEITYWGGRIESVKEGDNITGFVLSLPLGQYEKHSIVLRDYENDANFKVFGCTSLQKAICEKGSEKLWLKIGDFIRVTLERRYTNDKQQLVCCYKVDVLQGYIMSEDERQDFLAMKEYLIAKKSIDPEVSVANVTRPQPKRRGAPAPAPAPAAVATKAERPTRSARSSATPAAFSQVEILNDISSVSEEIEEEEDIIF